VIYLLLEQALIGGGNSLPRRRFKMNPPKTLVNCHWLVGPSDRLFSLKLYLFQPAQLKRLIGGNHDIVQADTSTSGTLLGTRQRGSHFYNLGQHNGFISLLPRLFLHLGEISLNYGAKPTRPSVRFRTVSTKFLTAFSSPTTKPNYSRTPAPNFGRIS